MRFKIIKGPMNASLAILVLMLGASASNVAVAQQWNIEPFIELIATYTDNVFLAQDGLEESDYVGQINPGIVIEKDEGRFTTDLRYRMQSVFFESDSDLNAIYHQLNATATLDVAAEKFFIDADAAIDQSVVDPRRPIPSSNVVATQNLGDVFVANINPYFIQQFGRSSTYMRLDYVWGVGRYDGFGLDTFSNVDDFEQQQARFYLIERGHEGGGDTHPESVAPDHAVRAIGRFQNHILGEEPGKGWHSGCILQPDGAFRDGGSGH